MSKLLALALVCLSACQYNPASPSPSPDSPIPSSSPSASHSVYPEIVISPSPEPSPLALQPFYVIDKITGATVKETASLLASADAATETVHSQCFKDFMLNRALIQTNGLTNQQVVDLIQSSTTHININLYYSPLSRVVGYTNPPNPTVNKNKKFFWGTTACDDASNNTHETLHLMKFVHDFNPSLRRPYSVPYSANAGFAKCCR